MWPVEHVVAVCHCLSVCLSVTSRSRSLSDEAGGACSERCVEAIRQCRPVPQLVCISHAVACVCLSRNLLAWPRVKNYVLVWPWSHEFALGHDVKEVRRSKLMLTSMLQDWEVKIKMLDTRPTPKHGSGRSHNNSQAKARTRLTPRPTHTPCWGQSQGKILVLKHRKVEALPPFFFEKLCQKLIIFWYARSRDNLTRTHYRFVHLTCHLGKSFFNIIIPTKARDYVFTSIRLSVCLFVTTITK